MTDLRASSHLFQAPWLRLGHAELQVGEGMEYILHTSAVHTHSAELVADIQKSF